MPMTTAQRRDPRIDAYIEKSAPFAQPILVRLRAQVHAACPSVRETIKWGFPHFEHHGVLCSMAAFKHHCAFGFWKGALVVEGASAADGEQAMGQFGRIGKLADLPSKPVLAAYIRKAAALNEAGVKAPRAEKKPKAALVVPDDLAAALKAHPEALAMFEAFSPGKQREYIEWLDEAKTEATRIRRRLQAVAWIAEGKVRNWKYGSA